MVRGRFAALAGLAVVFMVPVLAAAQAEKPVDVTREWVRTVESPSGRLTFSGTVDGDKLKGSMDADGQAMPTAGERQPKV